MLKTETRYADVILKDKRRQILASERLWEHNTVVEADEVDPSQIGELVRAATASLLHYTTEHGVALDWPTTRWHLFRSPLTGETIAILRVDVLQ